MATEKWWSEELRVADLRRVAELLDEQDVIDELTAFRPNDRVNFISAGFWHCEVPVQCAAARVARRVMTTASDD